MTGEPESERTLVQRALLGQEQAFRELFSRYYGKIMRYCGASLNGDRDEAADAAQETFIRAFRSLPSLQRPERFGAWLYAIADNVFKTSRRKTALREAATRGFAFSRVEGSEDESPFLREAKIRLVRSEIEALPEDRNKELLRLYYLDGSLTTREIADRICVPHGTVCVTLMRLRARIQKKLAAALMRLEEVSDAL